MLRGTPVPQDVVGNSPPFANNPQEVVRLQHCSYTFVNDPREILFVARLRRSPPGHGTARFQVHTTVFPLIRWSAAASDYPWNLRPHGCGLEVDNSVNFGFFLGKPNDFQWIVLWASCGKGAPLWG